MTTNLSVLFILILLHINQILCAPIQTEDNEDFHIFNLTVPRHDPTNACLKFQSSFFIRVNYTARVQDEEIVREVNISLSDADDFSYSGFCQPDKNQIEFLFLNDWRLEFYFYKINETYIFNHVVLYYNLDGPLFPGSIHHGAQSETYDSTFINSSLSKSYRCYSGLRIDLGEIVIDLLNFKVEPFFNKRPNLPFDEEILCPGDIEPRPSILDQFKWVLYVIAGCFAFAILVGTCFLCCKNSENPKSRTIANSDQYETFDPEYDQNIDEQNNNEITVNDKCLNCKTKLVARV